MPTNAVIVRPPQTDDELYEFVQMLWGVTIPRTPVCPEHQTPFEAFADAYFARHPVAVWKASRGLGGKSRTLAYLDLTEIVVLGSQNTLLGGSGAQSLNVHEAMREGWDWDMAPRHMIKQETNITTKLTNGGYIRALTASQRSVRGPHPQRLRLDEIDEMDQDILDAALGQPMPRKNKRGEMVNTSTVMSSTHQYADKTMTAMLRQAKERNWPIFQWCIASGSLVTTDRGEVPVEEVLTTDRVLTRNGFRQVQHVSFMGYKRTVSLHVGGRSLRLTPDHRVATVDGWRTASALATDAMSPVRSNPRVLRCEAVPLSTHSGSGLIPVGAGSVFSVGNDLKVTDIDTGSVPTQMVQSHTRRDSAYDSFPDPSVSLHGAVLTGEFLDPVAITTTSRPLDAVGEHGDMLTPVWDIGVEGDHEFVAEGIVVHNCYKETSNLTDGWLSPDFIARKREEVPARMWEIEYDLQEPGVGDRAFDTSAVEKMFSGEKKRGQYNKIYDAEYTATEEYAFEQPKNNATYVTAADWAQTKDRTVIAVFDTTAEPMRLVYYYRGHRMPYPNMIHKFNKAKKKYRGTAIHDATGLGNVVKDYIEGEVENFIMAGRARADMLTEYVAAVERGEMFAPMVTSAFIEHKFCSVDDLYRTGQEFHLPDTVCAFALAWHKAGRKRRPVVPTWEILRDGGTSPWTDQKAEQSEFSFGV